MIRKLALASIGLSINMFVSVFMHSPSYAVPMPAYTGHSENLNSVVNFAVLPPGDPFLSVLTPMFQSSLSLRMPVPRVSLDAPRHQGFLVQSDRLVSLSMLGMRPPFLSVSAALTDVRVIIRMVSSIAMARTVYQAASEDHRGLHKAAWSAAPCRSR